MYNSFFSLHHCVLFLTQQRDTFIHVSYQPGNLPLCDLNVPVGNFHHLCHFETLAIPVRLLQTLPQPCHLTFLRVDSRIKILVLLLNLFVLKNHLPYASSKQRQGFVIVIHHKEFAHKFTFFSSHRKINSIYFCKIQTY